MKLPNIITLSRIPVLFIIWALVTIRFPGSATLAFLLFLAGAATDWLDGFLARRFKLVSNFGKLMDALIDKILMIGVMVVLLGIRVIPSWCSVFVILILSREFIITGLRLMATAEGRVLAAEASGKYKTVFQIVSLSLFLLYWAILRDFSPWMSVNVGTIVLQTVYFLAVASFILATFFTASSGISYLCKYWDVFTENGRA